MSLTFQHELMSDIYQEMSDCIEIHYQEIATHKHVKRLDPDWDQFFEMEDKGICRCFTARADNELVGYFITFTCPHIHFRGCIMSHNDAVFLHPAWRGVGAYRFFCAAIQDLKDNTDSDMLAVHMKLHAPFRKLLTKLGFEQTEENWELEL